MTREEAEQAVSRCTRDELRILRALEPREVVVFLEAKLFCDARFWDKNTWQRLA